MVGTRNRALIIIGGKEDRSGDKVILGEVARRVGSGKLVVTTVAMPDPVDLFEKYERAFRSLGVKHVFNLEIDQRSDAMDDSKIRIMDDAVGIFFTGGDQLKITSQIGDTPIFQRIRQLYRDGGVIAGTSAGASVMSETMLVAGNGQQSHMVGDSTRMGPGLGLIDRVIIDQHFAERGRIGRLIGAVAQNTKNLGLGIDEQTAIVVERDESFYVLGSGAVYVIDGAEVGYSNIAEEEENKTMSIHGLKLHVLSQGDSFNLDSRRPERLSRRKAEELPEKQCNKAS